MADEPTRPQHPANQPNADRDSSAPSVGRIEIASLFQGLLPPPELIREYQELIPDAGERLFAWVEKEMKHRHALEMKELTGQIDLAREDRSLDRRGQDRAFLVAITFGLFSLIAILNGFAIGGSILGGGTLATIVIAFLATRGRASHQEGSSLERTGDPK